jgi:hypothetical protein
MYGITPEAYEKLTPKQKAIAVADALDDCARRCADNMLVAGTWVEKSFTGAAERLRELSEEI